MADIHCKSISDVPKKAATKMNSSFEKKLRSWLLSLPLEERAKVLSVQDAGFISTIFHFGARLPSSRKPFQPESNDGKTGTCGDSPSAPNTESWRTEVLVSDIEKVFRDYCEKKEVASDSISTKNIAMQGFTSDTSPARGTDTSVESTTIAGSSNLGLGDTIEFERIHAVNGEGEDSIEVEKVTTVHLAGSEENSLLPNKEPHGKSATNKWDASLSDDIRLVFPTTHKLAREFSSKSMEETKEPPTNILPFLSLNPESLAELMSMNLGESKTPASWINVLRENAENSDDSTVSLLTVIMSRIYFSAIEAYQSCHDVDGVDSVNGQNVHSFGDDNNCEEQDKSEQPGERNEHGITAESDVVNVSNTSSRVEMLENVKDYDGSFESSLPPSLFHLPDVLQNFSSQSDLDHLTKILGQDISAEQLPFFPLKYASGLEVSNLEKIDSVLMKIVKSAISRAVEARYFEKDSNVLDPTPQRELSEEKNVGEGILITQDTQQKNTAVKKKKKKKKRKRKTSTVDVHQGKEPVPVLPKTNQVSKKEDADKVKALPATESKPSMKKQTLTTPTVDKIPALPVANSFDTDRTAHSSKDSSAATEFAPPTKNEEEEEDSVITLSRFEGVGPRYVVVAGSDSPVDNKEKLAAVTKADDETGDDDDQWETVEIKVRGKNRNRNGEQRAHAGNSAHNGQTNATNGRKVKKGRTSESRKRNAHRKIARDILASVLDSVELEIKRNKKSEVKTQEEKRRRSPQSEQQGLMADQQSKIPRTKIFSMRDVVLRKPGVPPNKSSRNQGSVSSQTKQRSSTTLDTVRSEASDRMKKDKKRTSNQTVTTLADQSTTQTLPETLSGTSNTQISVATEEVDNVSDKNARVQAGSVAGLDGTGSGVETNESEPSSSKVTTIAATDGSPSPPLSTLLGPGNSNSASSSVASSLEAPHSLNHRHHHSSCGNENDVGYHLLDVCDRLSRDMNVFMARRALALTARRRERGALLAALQDTVSNLWAGHGEVEMYGSCATQLDLPSSDVDAVILGLDKHPETIMDQSSAPTNVTTDSSKAQPGNELDLGVPSQEGQGSNAFGHNQPHLRNHYSRPSNSERVMILAAELERQPWAVQVKAIPTASVPVVKILADPSKIPGAVTSFGSGGDWMVQQHHMAAQAAAAAAGVNPPPQSPSGDKGSFTNSTQAPTQFPPHTPPPWRGADVMNGLFKVDITFEGPEHGGIGSTTFSAEAIRDACNESGLPAEGTPFVQVLMVLKELLAQRRLNEPFSGGLSSYALLLLVVAVVKERSIIREEMERIERHRKLVTGENTVIVTRKLEQGGQKHGGGKDNGHKSHKEVNVSESSSNTKIMSNKSPKQSNLSQGEQKSCCTKSEKAEDANICDQADIAKKSTKVASSSQSSWASIARKHSNGTTDKRAVNSQVQSTKSSNQQNKQKPLPPKVTSFAEAVSRKQLTQNQQTSQQSRKRDEGKKQVKRVETSNSDNKIAVNSASTSKVQLSTKPKSAKTLSQKTSSSLTKEISKTAAPPSKAKQPASMNESSSLEQPKFIQASTPTQPDSNLNGVPSLFPQGSNDVLEVLCSGETTAGKLLLHFLLYYGELFDSRIAAIDVVGSYNHDTQSGRSPLSTHSSPFVNRRSGGSIDPYTGMLTVDPIVVYDPWEGGRGTNVTRSCYAWSSIRWHFGQCYMTLSSAVERTGTSPSTTSIPSETSQKEIPTISLAGDTNMEQNISKNCKNKDISTNKSQNKSSDTGLQPPVDMVSPLLELLVSF
mmetsp:Transcript_11569/g.16990  ORF Transcript_11569/g.16990 Transcript_11569/m.16990 type:complete len:1759 (+) Transcript_11569:317-5593(+)